MESPQEAQTATYAPGWRIELATFPSVSVKFNQATAEPSDLVYEHRQRVRFENALKIPDSAVHVIEEKVLYEIDSQSKLGIKRHVNLERGTCDCDDWNYRGFEVNCKHLIKAALHAKINLSKPKPVELGCAWTPDTCPGCWLERGCKAHADRVAAAEAKDREYVAMKDVF